jgi:hypothetical protein
MTTKLSKHPLGDNAGSALMGSFEHHLTVFPHAVR